MVRQKKGNNSKDSHFSIESKLSNIEVIEKDIPLRIMIKPISELIKEDRDDFDYYEPIDELIDYDELMLYSLEDALDFSNESRDPTNDSNPFFKYIEISSIETLTGNISDYSEIPCEEDMVPSRARKVIHEGNILISTVRPTRKAVAIVNKSFENEICSTGFAVVKPKNGIDLNYLHYILRSDLVAKQFKKYASGSSYPAILEKHIKMTIVPIPEKDTQERIGREWHQLADHLEKIKRTLETKCNEFNSSAEDIILKSTPAIIKKQQMDLTEF